MSEADNISKAKLLSEDPRKRLDEAIDDFEREVRKTKAGPELVYLLAEIKVLAEKARKKPDGRKSQLYIRMRRLMQWKPNENELHAAKYVPRIRRAVRQMIGMGWFEKAKKEFEEEQKKIGESGQIETIDSDTDISHDDTKSENI